MVIENMCKSNSNTYLLNIQEEKMKKYLVFSLTVLAVVFSYSLTSHAKGQSSIENTGASGVVVGVLMCGVGHPWPKPCASA